MCPSDPADPAAPGSPRATLWLGLGAAAGLACAALSLLASGSGDALPPHAAASVNGVVIPIEAHERAVAALASDRREAVGPGERRHVLDRMLEEELLVQRGLELGLARHDRRVRGDLVAAVIELVVSQADDEEPDAEAVRAFYEENRDYFARTERLRVRALWVRGDPLRPDAEALARAHDAAQRLRAGEDWDAVEADAGDPQVAPVPRDLLPPTKLREYLGPTATRTAAELEVGAISEPQRVAGGYRVIQLEGRAPGFAPPLAEVEDEVRAELRRRAGDRALRDYLDTLRDEAVVRLREESP
jgi:parvulin-like peptidyl-prolyl isomerase